MRILVACESSGKVREAFRKLGHDAWSADILPADDGSPYHFTGDVRKVLSFAFTNEHGKWDMLVGFPPCTHLCVSGARYFKIKRADGRQQSGIDFFMMLANLDIPKIVLENPVGIMSTKYRKPDQIIQPYNFGHDASKQTCLWLKGVPKLEATGPYIEPNLITYKGNRVTKRWGNQSPCGASNLGPSEDRWKKRSQTYQGIADAMANQWGAK